MPTATISGTNTICSGQSATLTASGGGTYAWSTGATTALITVNPTTTTTYTATVTLNGCTSTVSRVVTVNPLPTATVSGTNTICSGQSTILTASGGGTYTWSTGATTASITVSPTTTTTYTATVTLNGCTSIASRIVTVNPLPTATISGTNTICSGQSATLTASGGGTYAWSTGATTALITVNPTTTTTYTATVTLNGCTSTVSRVVTVNPLPTATVSGTNTICSGQSTILTASGGGTYAWSTGATTSSITVSPTTSTTYTATVTLNGCTSIASRVVTVNPNPIFNLVGTQTVCSGSVLTISVVSPTNDLNNLSGYEWSPNIELDNIALNTTNNPIIVNYSFSGTSSITGCTGTATLPITINPAPPSFTISVTENSGITANDLIICAGDPVTLTASGTSAPTWSNGVTAQLITVSPTTTTTYIATLTNAFGCSRTDSRTITVNPLPTISITNPNPVICSGTSVTLSAFPTTGLNSFSWTPGGQTSSNISVTPSTSTTYTLTARSTTTGCTNSASTTITVNSVNNSVCCTAPSLPPFNSPFNASALPNNSIIQVNANMTINQNLTFTGCTLRMGPNVKIIVNPGMTLNLINCTLFSCSEMWDGIEILAGGILNLNGTRIEDAKEGVKSLSNASLTVNNCNFNKNKTGIRLEQWTTAFTGVNNSTFDCTATLNSPNGFLKAPFVNKKSHYGIYLTGMENVTIGGTTINNFQNLEVGIYAQRCTNVTIQRNNFTNINSTCPVSGACTSATIKGWCIYTYSNNNLTIGNSTNATLGNTFQNSHNGIKLELAHKFAVYRNTFNNIITPAPPGVTLNNSDAHCISVIDNVDESFISYVENNTFTNFEHGIYYFNNESSSLNITQNQFGNFNSVLASAIYLHENPVQNIYINRNNFNVTAGQTGQIAIRLQNASLTGNGAIISANRINNVSRGVVLTKYNNSSILNHNTTSMAFGTTPAGIFFPANATNSRGIQLQNCQNTTVRNNFIQKAAPDPTNAVTTNLIGIDINISCTNSIIQDNNLQRLGTGINIFGTPNNPLQLKCNYMSSNMSGLTLDNTSIGNQGTSTNPQDNQWAVLTTTMFNNGARYARELTTNNSPIFFARTNSLPMFPPGPGMIPFTALTFNSGLSGTYTCSVPIGSTQSAMGLVANKEEEYSGLSQEEERVLDIEVFKILKRNTDYYDPSSLEGQEIESYLDSLEATNAGKIFRFEEKVIDNDTLGALSEVDGIFPTTDIEQNFKIVNDIYWRTWFMGIYSFSPEDSAALFDVAYQDPIYGGTAVFSARVMLGIDVENSSTRRSSNSISSNTILELNFVRFFPNPATDYVNYEITLEPNETASLEIIDLFGRIIFSKKIDYDNKTGFIDFKEKESGLYTFKVNLKGKSETGKLVVE